MENMYLSYRDFKNHINDLAKGECRCDVEEIRKRISETEEFGLVDLIRELLETRQNYISQYDYSVCDDDQIMDVLNEIRKKINCIDNKEIWYMVKFSSIKAISSFIYK